MRRSCYGRKTGNGSSPDPAVWFRTGSTVRYCQCAAASFRPRRRAATALCLEARDGIHPGVHPDPAAQTALPVWTAWHSAQAESAVFQQLIRNAQKQFPEVSFRFRKTADGTTIDYQAADQQRLQQAGSWLAQQQKALFNNYLEQHYYKRHGDDNSHLIRPDHVRIAADSSAELLELARTLQRVIVSSASAEQKQRYQNDERLLVVAGLLNFVQSIPYDPLVSADGQRGITFLMPEQVLVQNRGDCDSKSVLMMTLLTALYPELPQAIVYVPDHALLAVALPRQTGNEEMIRINGKAFLPLEVAGPAEIPPGVTGKKAGYLSVITNINMICFSWQR